MLQAFDQTFDILPRAVSHYNLLHAFVLYLSLVFALSLLLRIRFYAAVYVIARHIHESCESLFNLLQKHKLLLMKDGIVIWVGMYVAVLLVYSTLNYFVWPWAAISIDDLAKINPASLVFELSLLGLMLALDFYMIAQVTVIDVKRVVTDLTMAEEWLGGRLNSLFDRVLGDWNPIRKFADTKAMENLDWFRGIFRNSLAMMIAQLVVRILFAASLFIQYAVK